MGPRYLVARVGGHRVALVLEATRELVPSRPLTRLPGAPAWVPGLFNLRGAVLTVVDLGVRLGGEASEGPIVVVEAGGRRFGLRVQSVESVLTPGVSEQPVEAARAADGVVRGLVPVGDGAALVVDLEALQSAALADG